MQDQSNYKVFFIISNETALNNTIHYSLSKNKGTINFTEVIKLDNDNEDFTTYVYSFEIIPNYLTNSSSNWTYLGWNVI